MKLIIGNKAYSSWSLRGWLACRQSGLPFDTVAVRLYDDDWDRRRQGADLAPSAGNVPILWDGDTAVWDSLAIIEFLAERAGRDLFWPKDDAARALARSLAAEMHSGFAALREKCTMNVRRTYPACEQDSDVLAELSRITDLWAHARARASGSGDFLFGGFGAVDIMFAPVVTRIATYALPVAPFAASYCAAVRAHPFMQDWLAAAHAEDAVIAKFEQPVVA